MDTPSPKAGLGVVGAGAAACAVCCAGPILGVLTATGVASLLGAVVFGVVGFTIVAVIGAAAVWRRRRRTRCAPGEVPVVLSRPAAGSAAPSPSRGRP